MAGVMPASRGVMKKKTIKKVTKPVKKAAAAAVEVKPIVKSMVLDFDWDDPKNQFNSVS